MKLISTNPSLTYETIGSVEITAIDEIDNIVIQSHKSQIKWHNLGVIGRINLLRKLSNKFFENINPLAELQSIEMGMPINQSMADINFGIEYFNSYLDKGAEYLKPTITFENDAKSDTVYFEPYGVVACIVPWNYPFSNFVWQCGQNLVAGNSVIFKHSEESPLCGKLIDEIVNSILPDGVFIEIYGDGSIGEKLVKSDVNLICFTGSTTTGIKINELAASRLIPTSLELGGSALTHPHIPN
jgi:aldehyde dehydrogenase (NAD+)/succinate-semialdehyde dehydrogenase/glutarate-semialdehyde dehydrogenase